jgi:hypothetical protein
MSLLDEETGSPGVVTTRVVAYGLAVIGFLLPLFPTHLGGDVIGVLALAVPALVFAMLLIAPDALGATFRRWGGRAGQRTISPILMLAVVGLFVVGIAAGVVDATLALLPAGVCAVIAVLLGLGAARRPMPGGLVGAVIFLALYGAAYGYGALIFADIRFDRAPAQPFQALVENRYVSRGRNGPAYTLVLAPFGPVTKQVRASVSAASYAALDVGAVACVALHPGALKMAWFTAAACPAA